MPSAGVPDKIRCRFCPWSTPRGWLMGKNGKHTTHTMRLHHHLNHTHPYELRKIREWLDRDYSDERYLQVN